MEEYLDALDAAFDLYREELAAGAKKQRPMGGFLGFGRSIKDDECHERLDERVGKAVSGIVEMKPSPEQAERAVRKLLRDDRGTWIETAQWMLRAVERHSIPLIPFLSREAAEHFYQEYGSRYRRWERLPAQKQVYQELKKQAGR